MNIDLTKLATEEINPNTTHIDSLSTLEMLQLINQEDHLVAQAVKQALPAIAQAVDSAYTTLYQGGRLFYLGAGTSGRLGVLDASECPPTFGVDSSLVVGIIAGGQQALRNAVEGAEDDRGAAIRDLKAHNFSSKDMLVGISASGRTPYVHAGLEHAFNLQAKTALIACARQLEQTPYINTLIEVLPGAEVISGSTRLKSGSAQKMVLNMISTGAMIRLGKVFGNLMVDVRPANAKLVERQIRIVQLATGCQPQEAVQILNTAKGNVKAAILMTLMQISYEQATKNLEQAKGSINKAMHF